MRTRFHLVLFVASLARFSLVAYAPNMVLPARVVALICVHVLLSICRACKSKEIRKSTALLSALIVLVI